MKTPRSSSLDARSVSASPQDYSREASCSPKAPTVGALQTLPAVEEDERYGQASTSPWLIALRRPAYPRAVYPVDR